MGVLLVYSNFNILLEILEDVFNIRLGNLVFVII